MPNPNLLQAEQIEKYLQAKISISGFAGAGADDVVTTELSTAATNAGVSLAVSNGIDTMGFITSGAANKVEIKDAGTEAAITDQAGNEVYGRLTEASGVYTLSYYSIVSGTETAYTLPATTIDAYFNYLFTFAKLPIDALTNVTNIVVGEDPRQFRARIVESLTISALNTLSLLSKLPVTGSKVILSISGKSEFETQSFTRSSKTITWTPTNRYDLVVGKYNVWAIYETFEL